MDAISHIYFGREYLKNNSWLEEKIKDRDHFLFSNVFPDFDLLQLAFSKKKSIDLHNARFNQLNDTVLGIALHSENINGSHGLDYYTHKRDGYIDRYRNEVKQVLQHYNSYLYDDFEHPVIEIVSGYKLAQKDNDLKEKVNEIMENFDYHYWKALDELPLGKGKLYSTFYVFLSKFVAEKYKKMIYDPANVLVNIYRAINKKVFLGKKTYKLLYDNMRNAVKDLYFVVNPEPFLESSAELITFDNVKEYEPDLVYQTTS